MSNLVYPRLFDWVKGYLESPNNGEEDNKYVMHQSFGILI